MLSRPRIVDNLSSTSIIVAFAGLFVGRLMIYPVALAPGSFLERVAAHTQAWDLGHRVLLLGMLALIPATLGLQRAMRDRSPMLAGVATGLTIFGASLGVGQFALDYAMLAASQIDTPAAGSQFLEALEGNSFTQWMFYRLPDVAQLGLILFTVALWRQGAAWRLPAVLVTVAAAAFVVAPFLAGAMGVRIALGLLFVGFSTVAWRIARPPSSGLAEPSGNA